MPEWVKSVDWNGVREVGAAAQNVALQPVSLGLGMVFIGAFRDDAVARTLAFPDDHALLAILSIGPPGR